MDEEPFELTQRHADNAGVLRDVRAILAGMLGSEARNLVVLVKDGEVTLLGRVPERWMQLEVEHECLRVEGVHYVVSHLLAANHAAH